MFGAQGGDDCRGSCVARVRLAGGAFDNEPLSEARTVRRVGFVFVVRVQAVCGVDGKQEALCEIVRQIVRVKFETAIDSFEQMREQRGVCALFRAAAHFFVVEESDDADAVFCGLSGEGGEAGVHGGQVIEARGGNEFAVEAEKGTGLCEVDVQIIGEDVFGFVTDFPREFFEEEFVSDFFFEQCGNGRHRGLTVELFALVRFAVEVDREARNRQQRAGKVEQAKLRRKGVFAAQHDLPCQRQRAIKPAGQNQSAVRFDIYETVAVPREPRRSLDAEAGKVGMGRCDTKAALCFRTDGKSEQRRAEDFRVVPSARREQPWLAPDER